VKASVVLSRQTISNEEGNMTKKLLGVFAAVGLVLALSAPLAAQSTRLSANIPFEFNVAGKTLPAGEYTIENINALGVVSISNFDSQTSALVLTHRGETTTGDRGTAALNFNRYGNTYFLSQIWNGYTGFENKLPVNRTEKELSRTASVQKFEVLASLARR
jgi:hypothetical protein